MAYRRFEPNFVHDLNPDCLWFKKNLDIYNFKKLDIYNFKKLVIYNFKKLDNLNI